MPSRVRWAYILVSLLVGTLAAFQADKFRSQVLPGRVLMSGKSLTLRCWVPRHEDHRVLVLQVASLTGASLWRSDKKLGTEFDEIVYELRVERLPCGTFDALCLLVDKHDKHHVSRQEVLSKGTCNSEVR